MSILFPSANEGRGLFDDAGSNGNGSANNGRHDRRPAPPPVDRNRSDQRHSRVDELENRVQRLTVVCQAMWELLSPEVGLDLDELAMAVDDLAVTAANGDVAESDSETVAETAGCPQCGKTMPVEASVCLFCTARSAIQTD